MKIHKQLLSFFLSALLLCQIPETAVYASVSDNSTDPSDNSFTVSSNDFTVNDEIDTDLYSDTAENNQVTLTFYDSDSQTILMQIPLPYQGSAVHISDVYNTYDFLKPVRSGYQVSAWNCITNGKTYSKASTLYSLSIKRNLEFSAIWKTTPYNFQINYETNGGTICVIPMPMAILSKYRIPSASRTILSSSRMQAEKIIYLPAGIRMLP